MNCGRRVLTTCTTKTVFQGSGSHSLISGESRCFNSERLETRVTQDERGRRVDSHATHAACRSSRRVLEVVDEITMVASSPDESCAMVSSLTEEV